MNSEWGRRLAWSRTPAWGAGNPSSNLGGPTQKFKHTHSNFGLRGRSLTWLGYRPWAPEVWVQIPAAPREHSLLFDLY